MVVAQRPTTAGHYLWIMCLRSGTGCGGERASLATEDALQAQQQFVAARDRNLGIFGKGCDQVGNMVLALKQEADQAAVEQHFPVAQLIEYVFDDMGETHHFIEAE